MSFSHIFYYCMERLYTTTIVKIRGPFSWYILARYLLHVSIFCINILDVGLSQTETCSVFVRHWMKWTKFMLCQTVSYSASNFHFIQNVYCASLCVCQNVHNAVPYALIYTMFISTDYTPVTCFIFYSSARGLQLLLPFKGLFRWRLHSRITSLWQLANIRYSSVEYEAMWQHKLALLLQFTVGTRWMCASLWQFFARSVVGIQEPEQTHYTCDIWRSEGED